MQLDAANNGIYLSSNGRHVYVVVNQSRSLDIERLSVATGAESFVADGEQPSVSPDRRRRAFGSGTPSSGERNGRSPISQGP